MFKLALFCLLVSKNIQVSVSDENTTEDDLNVTENYYTAAVLDFYPPGRNFSDDHEKVQANLKEYKKWIDKVKEHDVDILIFPEATLNYNDLSKANLRKFAISLPEEAVDREYEYNCEYSSNAILNELSEAVGNASIYVLVNIVEIEECDTSNCSLYNTNIVFNRYGCIISKYRKFNLFMEPSMTAPVQVELATFETDFGVTFGHFICFDILFKSPAYDLVLSNVSHIILPSMWYSEIPFLTSVQLQQSFAYRNNIVLLSSGANSPSISNTGSGIYIGKHGPVDSVMSCSNETKIIISKVPKDINDDSITVNREKPKTESCTIAEMDELKTWSFTPENIHPLKEHFHFNDESIDCEFTINFTKSTFNIDRNIGYTYKLAVFNGIRTSKIVNTGLIYCAIIPCMTDDISTCGHKFKHSENLVPSVTFNSINIVTKLKKEGESLIMPTSLDFTMHSLDVDDFSFKEVQSDDNHQVFEVKSESVLNDILTFGIMGRNYTADNKDFQVLQAIVAEVQTTESEIQESTEHSSIEEVIDLPEESSNQLLGWISYGTLMFVLCIIAAILVYRRLQDPYEHPLIVMRRKSEMNTA